MKLRKIELWLDDKDYDLVQDHITSIQVALFAGHLEHLLESESNIAGSSLAEALRQFDDVCNDYWDDDDEQENLI